MGDMADDLMDRLGSIESFYDCDEWCNGCLACADNDQWVTQDGKIYKIKTLETSHLVNILNYVKRHRKLNYFGRDRMNNVKFEAQGRGCTQANGVWTARGAIK